MNISPTLLLAILLFVSLCSSCNNPGKDAEETLRFANGNIASSTKLIQQQTTRIYSALDEKLNDPATSDKASLWEPKARSIQRLTTQFCSYIQALKEQANPKGDQLWSRIQIFKDSLFSMDTLIKNEFRTLISSFPNSYDATVNSEMFITKTVGDLSLIAQQVFLSQLASQVRVIENRLAVFCLEQCSSSHFVYDSYTVIVGQSSSVVGSEDEVEITDGVGAFSRKAQPQITIGGDAIAVSEDGAAYYVFKAPKKAGKYSMPVKIQFTDSEGRRQQVQKIFEYSVVKK